MNCKDTMKHLLLLFSICATSLFAQGPAITSWLQNTTIKGTYYVQGNSTAISNNIVVNVQKVQYSATSVYINTNGIPSYPTGPFLDGNPSVAQSQNAIFKFPLNPQKNTGTPTNTTPGNIGNFINGVALFDYRDGVSWKTSLNKLQGGPSGGMGDNIWNRDAIVAERIGFDCAKGHPSMGNYHHHQNPSSFKLDKNVISNICSLYDADGLYTINATAHSPLIGYAYDGFPIYGAYGYKNVDGTGGITRMKSSFQLRSITVRTHYADGSDVLDGPPISTTYPLGYFREDYEFVSHPEPEYLDQHNGRFCITPEYPNGTYAYFCTVDENWNSAYPYVVGPTFYGVKTAGKVTSITEPTTVYTASNPSLEITPTAITINAAATSVNITVTSNVDWTASSNQTWAVPNKTSGNGNSTVSVQCSENKQTGNRFAIITFSANGLANKYATITQKDSIITLTLNKQSLLFPAYPSSDSSITITSNAGWIISCPQQWIHVNPIQGNGNASLAVSVDENVQQTQRAGTITVQSGTSVIKTIAVTQLDSVKVPSVMSADIDTIYLYAANKSYHTFKLLSNTSWQAVSPASWLTIEPGTGNGNSTITVTAFGNNSSTPRPTAILITGNDVKDIIIPVIQKDTVFLSLKLSADTLLVPAKGAQHSIILTSNTPWKAQSTSSWLEVQSDSGKASGLLTFSTESNFNAPRRVGSIIVEGNGVSQRTLTVIQSDTVLIPNNINENNNISIASILPTPADDILVIQSNSIIKNSLMLTLHDLNGRTLAQTSLLQGSTIAFFDTSTLYNGTYYLSIQGDGYDLQKTILVQHK